MAGKLKVVSGNSLVTLPAVSAFALAGKIRTVNSKIIIAHDLIRGICSIILPSFIFIHGGSHSLMRIAKSLTTTLIHTLCKFAIHCSIRPSYLLPYSILMLGAKIFPALGKSCCNICSSGVSNTESIFWFP